MFFGWIERLLAGDNAVYVEIDRHELRLKDGASGKQMVVPAAVALSMEKTPTIIAVGKHAASGVPDSTTIWPFDHPRSVINHFQLGERLLQYSLFALHHEPPVRRFRPRPIVLLRCAEEWAGGLTQIERRALIELAYGALAREVWLWEGRPPTTQELQDGAFRRSPYIAKA